MTYQLTPEKLASITDVEIAFGTVRLLPAWEDIPEEFKQGNLYTQLASAIFNASKLPDGQMVFKSGFEAKYLNHAVRAHLASWQPKHEHKIAGVGFMIAQTAVLIPRASCTTSQSSS